MIRLYINEPKEKGRYEVPDVLVPGFEEKQQVRSAWLPLPGRVLPLPPQPALLARRPHWCFWWRSRPQARAFQHRSLL